LFLRYAVPPIDVALGLVIPINCFIDWIFLIPVPTTQRFEIVLETVIESIDRAEAVVKRFAEASGFDQDEVHRIGMAVREGTINAYNYGNRQDRRKKILLIMELEESSADSRMVVRLVDEGPGFDLNDIPDPLAEENLLRTSGRGIFLIRAFMDDFSVLRGSTGGAEVVMTKKLPHSVHERRRSH
jgi:serine/threonine-protein kinase RsbW